MTLPQTQFYGAVSLDGFLATPDDDLAWLLQFGGDAPGYAEFVAQLGAVAMGACTYEWLLRHHVRPGAPDAQPWPYAVPTWVFTHRELPVAPGADVRFVAGDVRPAHAAMRAAAAGRNVWIVGGGGLLAQFWDHGLLDELIVHVAPLTLGAGKPFLPRSLAAAPLRLVSARAHGDTFAELRYRVARSG